MNCNTKIGEVISGSYDNIAGIVVRKNDKVVYENYFNECTKDTNLHVFSVTKSIISILIGIAIDKGAIKSIDEKILDFFPEYNVPKGEKILQRITIKDILTMCAPYKHKSEDYSQYFTSNDWVKASLDLLGESGKVGEFRYAPIIGPDILSGILVNTTGQAVLDFAKEHLFDPLEIAVDNNINFHNKEEQLEFYNKINVNGWVAGPTGVNTAGWGLNLTPLAMAKLGQLYLNDGVWNTKQLVSKKWITESTMEQSRCNEWKLSYGYLWWIIDEKEQSFAAIGDGGNVIYVNREKDIVISIATIYTPHAKDSLKLIKEYIEPVF